MFRWLFNTTLFCTVYACNFFMQKTGIPTPKQFGNRIKRHFISERAERAWRRRRKKKDPYAFRKKR